MTERCRLDDNIIILHELEQAAYANPDYRFWQLLRNYLGVAFILASNIPPIAGQVDTFNWETFRG